MRWLLFLVCACGTPRTPPVRAMPAPPTGTICAPRPTTLMLPELDESKRHVVEIVDEKLFIDFVPTGIVEKDIEQNRLVHLFALRDGRVVFRVSSGTKAWDPATQTISNLGTPQWVPVAGHGWIFQTYPKPDVVEFQDIDPSRTGPARLRTVWRATKDAKRNYLSAGIVGVLDGMLVAIAMSRDYDEHDSTSRTVTLACIAGKDDVTTRTITLPDNLAWASTDAIRDHRMLLMRAMFGQGFGDWSTDVLVLDLDSGHVRVIGKAQGGHTRCTAMPHPHLELKWSDDRTSHREPDSNDLVFDGCTDGGFNTVDPVAETVDGIGSYQFEARNSK